MRGAVLVKEDLALGRCLGLRKLPGFSTRRPAVPVATPSAVARCAREGYAALVHSSWRTSLIAALATTAALTAFGASSALAAPREIAYTCGPDVCLLDPDNSSAVVNLTNNGTTSFDFAPGWSPDGKKLAFISTLNGTRNIYLMNPTRLPEKTASASRSRSPTTPTAAISANSRGRQT